MRAPSPVLFRLRDRDRKADQPDQLVGKTAERVIQRGARLAGIGDAGHRHEGDGDHRDRADRHRLADDGDDGADKQRQQLPALGATPSGTGMRNQIISVAPRAHREEAV